MAHTQRGSERQSVGTNDRPMAAVTSASPFARASPKMIDAAAAAASGRPLKLLTLLLVVQGDRVLLGMKKRGFGMGEHRATRPRACRRSCLN